MRPTKPETEQCEVEERRRSTGNGCRIRRTCAGDHRDGVLGISAGALTFDFARPYKARRLARAVDRA